MLTKSADETGKKPLANAGAFCYNPSDVLRKICVGCFAGTFVRTGGERKKPFRKGEFEMQTDMTAGKPAKIILNFTVPVFIGNVFQQFYNMVDAIIVGKFVGTKSLAAVGSTGTIMFLILGFLTEIGRAHV